MVVLQSIVLITLGFVAFFATGIDDTIAYAGSYLSNKKNLSKKLISFGIIIGTIIALGISIFAGKIMLNVPSRHLIGGSVLVTLGLLTFTRSWRGTKLTEAHTKRIENHLKKSSKQEYIGKPRLILLGLVLFFATGIDDILAYSNLIIAKGSWWPICTGVLLATFVSLFLAHLLAGKLKKFRHPEKIGGVIIILMGILIALKIL
jgi:cadmium resistance protein CadD (predicted permease)